MSEPVSHEELKAIALSHIRRLPGLNQDRLCVILGESPKGWDKGDRRHRRNAKICKLIRELAADGLIRMEREQFASKHDPYRLYPIDWKSKSKPLFQPAGDRNFGKCVTYIDPSLAGWTPPKSKSEQEREMGNQRTQSTIDRIRLAIAQLDRMGRAYEQQEVLKLAESSTSFLGSHLEMREEVNAAVRESQAKYPPAKLTIELDRLKEEIRLMALRHEAEIRELQQQRLKDSVADVLLGKRKEASDRLSKLLDGKAQLEGDIESTLKSIEVLDGLLEGEAPEVLEVLPFVAVGSGGGNGNGKKAGAIGGEV